MPGADPARRALHTALSGSRGTSLWAVSRVGHHCRDSPRIRFATAARRHALARRRPYAIYRGHPDIGRKVATRRRYFCSLDGSAYLSRRPDAALIIPPVPVAVNDADSLISPLC